MEFQSENYCLHLLHQTMSSCYVSVVWLILITTSASVDMGIGCCNHKKNAGKITVANDIGAMTFFGEGIAYAGGSLPHWHIDERMVK